MKIKKLNLLVLALVLSISVIGCTNDPNDVGMNTKDRNLSTQTRIDNRWDNNTDDNWNRDNNMNQDNLSTRNDLNNPMNNDFNDINGINDTRNGNLNDGMIRPGNMNGSNMNDQAKNHAKDITNLPEVSNASVVINKDTALVGLTLRGNTQNTMTTSLRRKVEKMVKDKNPNIKNVSVTTDPDLSTRIQSMSTKVLNGNPIEDFTDELGDLMKRMGNSLNNMAR